VHRIMSSMLQYNLCLSKVRSNESIAFVIEDSGLLLRTAPSSVTFYSLFSTHLNIGRAEVE
jgi:hypothetical protein